jgi:glycosyltransferase involved in cell wall biosynthesis
LRIYVVAEQYPSLYKPYFDTQFAEFLRAGHDLTVFALGTGDRSRSDHGAYDRLHDSTAYLPTGRGSLPRFSPRILSQFLAAPGARLEALRRAREARPPRLDTLTDAARLLSLPAEHPDFCLVHNLLAARRVRFLRDLYPEVPIAFYYHGGELPGVATVPDADAASAFGAADVVFTNTARSREHAIARGCPADRVFVSPVGFPLEDFPEQAGRQYRAGDRLNVLSIGRLSPEKGFRYAIEGVRQLVESGTRKLSYRIVGGGPLQGELAAQIDGGGLADQVCLTGPVSRQQLYEEMRRADVLVLPSIVVGTWEENQACVAQEAMLSHCLVIASATGGVPESVAPEQRSFLVPEGDATAIRVQLERAAALDTDALRALGAAGRAFAVGRYDIRVLNQQILDTATQHAPAPAGRAA